MARAKSTKKKAARKKAIRKKAVRKKAVRKKAVRKKAIRKKAARKQPAARKSAASLEGIARRIVHAATRSEAPKLDRLYAEHCLSLEPGAPPVIGHEELREKHRAFGKRFRRSSWSVRNRWLGKDTIAIEWDAELALTNGRTVQFLELAVYEVEAGLIRAERFFYDPGLLA